MPSPIAVEVVLTDGERELLESWAGRRTSVRAVAERSQIALAAAEGLTNAQIAVRLGIHRGTAARARGGARAHDDRSEDLNLLDRQFHVPCRGTSRDP